MTFNLKVIKLVLIFNYKLQLFMLYTQQFDYEYNSNEII